MCCQREAFASGQRVGEFESAGLNIDGLAHECRVGKEHDDIAGECSNGGVGPVDLAVCPDGLDAIEVIGIGEVGRDQIADIDAIACDRPVEVTKALEGDIRRFSCGTTGGIDGLALHHDAGGRSQKPRAGHLPVEVVNHAGAMVEFG
mgnify:CR=1 FL=1